jgi:transposase-like protein
MEVFMCPHCNNALTKVTKKGVFTTKRGRKIQRFKCHACFKTFSDQTTKPGYRLRRYRLRNRIFREFCRGISQREIAIELRIHRDTVARLLIAVAKEARKQNQRVRATLNPEIVVMDEMETFEHTKCKPVSIVVAVEEGTRKIIALTAAQMPAKGLLAEVSRRKYGYRADHRPRALRMTLHGLTQFNNLQVLKSDMSPRYPKYVRECLPNVQHVAFKGRRGCIVGQGELKRGGFDPLFDLNHTCARIRDLIKRLSRRTWCTTKVVERLQMFLDIFICHFNRRRMNQIRPILCKRA